MKLKSMLAGLGMVLSAASFNAHALTTAYTGTGGAGLVYSSETDLTWTQDGNLFKTLYDANNNLISQIASVTPSYNDPNNCLQTINADHFNTSTGQMTWWGGLAFVNYLNSIDYGGSNQWRLPTVTDTSAAGCNFAYSGTDCGYNVNTSTGELAALYYDELGAKAYRDTSGSGPQSGYNILGTSTTTDTTGSVGPFDNVHTSEYWSSTEYVPFPIIAWILDTSFGYQRYGDKVDQFYAWAVSPGQVAASAVPVPAAAWLFGPALMGLLGCKRRGHVG